MDTGAVTLSFIGIPASYRRGVSRVAADAGLLSDDGLTITITRLDRTPESCERIDQLVAAGSGPVIALLEPFDAAAVSHAISHGAFVADHEGEPEQVVAAISQALQGAAAIPLELMGRLAAGTTQHGPIELSDEEAAWLVALAAGITVVKVADDFGYSERAMFRRLADLYSRLGASNRAEALVSAERMGLLRTEVDRS